MTLIADSGALYALYDRDDQHHFAVRRAFQEGAKSLIVPSATLAEIDYLLRKFLGIEAELDFLEDLQSGAYRLEPFTPADLDRSRQLIAQYRDLDLGLADAAVMATAERLGTLRILTVDERDFRAVVSRNGTPFTLFPADLGS
jgi:uncharacterized protein